MITAANIVEFAYFLPGSISIGYLLLRTGWPKNRALEKNLKFGWSIALGAGFSLGLGALTIATGFVRVTPLGITDLFLLNALAGIAVSLCVLTARRMLASPKKVTVIVPKETMSASIAAEITVKRLDSENYFSDNSIEEKLEKIKKLIEKRQMQINTRPVLEFNEPLPEATNETAQGQELSTNAESEKRDTREAVKELEEETEELEEQTKTVSDALSELDRISKGSGGKKPETEEKEQENETSEDKGQREYIEKEEEELLSRLELAGKKQPTEPNEDGSDMEELDALKKLAEKQKVEKPKQTKKKIEKQKKAD